MPSEAQCGRHGTVISFPLDKQKGRTCPRDSRSSGVLLLPASPRPPFLFPTWPPTWRECTPTHGEIWECSFSPILLCYQLVWILGSLSQSLLRLSLLEGFSASNSENAGTGSQTSRTMPTSSHCREIISFVQALLSQILGRDAKCSALKEQEQRQFCPQQPDRSLSSYIVQNFCLHFIFTPIRRLEVFFLLLFIVLILSRLVCQLFFAIFTACCI